MRPLKLLLNVPLLLLLCSCIGMTPASTVEAFYRALDKGDADKALSLLAPEFVNMIGKDKVRAALQEAALETSQKGGIKDIEITKDNVVGDVAEVSALLKYGNGTQELQESKLVKNDGKWYLKPEK